MNVFIGTKDGATFWRELEARWKAREAAKVGTDTSNDVTLHGHPSTVTCIEHERIVICAECGEVLGEVEP
jgi:hypothetical protein